MVSSKFLIQRNIPAKAKIIKEIFQEIWSHKNPLNDEPEKDKIVTQLKSFYENSSSTIRIRKEKVPEIRFSAKNLQQVNNLRDSMEKLGFVEGKPQSKSGDRYYLPYYGKQKVIRFVEMIKPRTKNDICSLLSKH